MLVQLKQTPTSECLGHWVSVVAPFELEVHVWSLEVVHAVHFILRSFWGRIPRCFKYKPSYVVLAKPPRGLQSNMGATLFVYWFIVELSHRQ